MKDIQQLIKKNNQEGRYEDIFPKTFTDAVEDRESGKSLIDILSSFNMYFLSYNGSRELTRLQVPLSFRKTGLWITYVLYDKTVVTEWYAGEAIDDDSWKSPDNWRVGSNMLVGDISISSDGYWVVNGVITTTKAQGEQGITPMLRVGSNNHLQVSYTNGSSWVDASTNPVYTQFRINNNKLEQSVDLGQTWVVASDYIASWFRFTGTTGSSQADNVGKIQISRDNGVTWSDLSGEFTNSLHIKGYVATIATLPSSAVQGDIYGVGPTYDPSDTEQTNPIYTLYVKDSTGWVNNGNFNSISAGVVQVLGNSTTEIPNQKLLTDVLPSRNISKEFPTGGVTSTGEANGDRYSLTEAISKLSVYNFGIRFRIIFKDRNNNGAISTFEYLGGDYTNITNWMDVSDTYMLLNNGKHIYSGLCSANTDFLFNKLPIGTRVKLTIKNMVYDSGDSPNAILIASNNESRVNIGYFDRDVVIETVTTIDSIDTLRLIIGGASSYEFTLESKNVWEAIEDTTNGIAITKGSIKGSPISIYHNILAGESLKIKITNLTNISNYLPYMFTRKDGIATGDATGGFSFEGTFYLNITSDIDEIRLVSNGAYYDYEISTLSVNERFNKLTSPKLISEGTISSSSTINIQNIKKGSVVKLSISNIISSSEYAPNAYLSLNGETGSSAIFGEYRNSVELYTITEKDADTLRLVCYNEPYSYKLELLQEAPDIINIQHYNASSFIVSSLQNKYCQNPSNIINKTNGDMLVVYAASKSIYCENDGYNSKYLALSKYNVADTTNTKTIELTKTIGEEMLEGDSHRVYQNPNIIGLNDSFVVITECVNGDSYYIGYIKEQYNNINEYYDKSTQIKGVCTINEIDMTSTNIQNISATYIAEPPSVNYILPQCQIYEHNSVFYTALCYVGESSNVVLVIKSLDGVNWESITAYKTQGDETACCVKGNSLYIIQRGYDKVVSVSLSTGLVEDYSNIPIYEERPYMFICNSEIYACVGYTDNKLRLPRIGYNIYHIKSNSCKKVMSISDSNGMNYASFIMNVNDLLINYTSCVRFKGEKSDYKIINDVGEYKDTSIPPYTSMTSEVIFDRVPFIQ